ncbi:E3 ubiquitin-protein ligase RNF4-like [Mizuhopecten yessoensis]|uniref:E3 ubiquitin-protein ligase RNF4 n=1 Tax=Mizuhopecten yessoensis TaxID=6573 RepID=A0A210PPI9_MIZYE|nr:E3 ubiquitin-protein ligase RNF4-like [Mizuhopecten yessoensis]OWF38419.1 E3 ubiquitin-protein ligase RNF4 [Mizuhopecten yessoensis]
MSSRVREDRSRARRHQRKRPQEAVLGRRPIHSRVIVNDDQNANDVQIVATRPNRSCIDLTDDTENDFIDLTSPTVLTAPAFNSTADESVLFVGAEAALDLSGDLILEEANEDDILAEALPELDDSAASLPGGRKITCPICLDSAERITRNGNRLSSTVCGHIFCELCIQSAIRAQKCCPTCRKKLTLKQIHPIFI